jgi:hypothetical protein
MSVAGPVEQAAALTQGLSVGSRVGAGAQRVAVLPAPDERPGGLSNPPVDSSAVFPALERRRDAVERPTERFSERQATPFFAQLLAQSAEPPGADAEAQRLAGRRQPSRLAVEDPVAEAQKRRGGARRGGDPEASAGAYERVKLSAREFAARRYGVARDADGVVFFQATSIDIRV